MHCCAGPQWCVCVCVCVPQVYTVHDAQCDCVRRPAAATQPNNHEVSWEGRYTVLTPHHPPSLLTTHPHSSPPTLTPHNPPSLLTTHPHSSHPPHSHHPPSLLTIYLHSSHPPHSSPPTSLLTTHPHSSPPILTPHHPPSLLTTQTQYTNIRTYEETCYCSTHQHKALSLPHLAEAVHLR